MTLLATTDYDKNRMRRFMAKIQVEQDGCWTWTAFVKPNGYGQFDRNLYAHRVSYEMLVGPIPTGLNIDHLCKNQRCVNPFHLEAVTQRENVLRGESFAAYRARQTHCHRGHELSGDNLYLRTRDYAGRECRKCKRITERARRAAA